MRNRGVREGEFGMRGKISRSPAHKRNKWNVLNEGVVGYVGERRVSE